MSITFESSVRHTLVSGRKVEYHEAGDGPALIMMHGGGPGANAWDNSYRVVAALAENFHLYLLNLPGYGGSDDAELEPGEFHDQFTARAIREFMDEVGVQTTSIYGASGSGSAAVRIAIDCPDRIKKVILKGPGQLPSLFTPGRPTGLTALFNYMKQPTRENMVSVMHQFVPNADAYSDDLVDRRMQAAQRRVMKPVPVRERPFAPMLTEITQPTLVLWGHQDNMVPFEGSLTALNAIPNVRVHLWGGGVGHFVEWERANEVARLVTDFLTNDDR